MTAGALPGLIPARLASTRLPRKPLADIAGKPMVVRVAERVTGLAGARAAGRPVWVLPLDLDVPETLLDALHAELFGPRPANAPTP